ncbi:MAG: hypothetical protein K8T91_24595, partial [Planctomycetes bacterium]|nr:hypothetical protein [Planctomycetota bacterium]
ERDSLNGTENSGTTERCHGASHFDSDEGNTQGRDRGEVRQYLVILSITHKFRPDEQPPAARIPRTLGPHAVPRVIRGGHGHGRLGPQREVGNSSFSAQRLKARLGK